MHAILAALFLLFKSFFSIWKAKVDRLLLILCLGMSIWSVVMVVKSSIQVFQAAGEGEDSENFSDQEEKFFELAGAALGFISAVYHVLFWSFCRKDGVESPKIKTAEDLESEEERYKIDPDFEEEIHNA